MTARRLAIVGGGPSCTYVTERLAATLPQLTEQFELEVHIYDMGGRFGDGQVHSAEQPGTSFLNRIVGQVAFAADESVQGAGPLLDKELRPTLHEWCQRKFRETGDPAFDLAPEGWPKRYMHGLALRDLFEKYIEILRAHPSITVDLHADEVVDVRAAGSRLRVVGESTGELDVDHVLMVTGHSTNDPAQSPRERRWLEFADRSESRFLPAAYPLERHLTPDVAPPGSTVGTIGTGLTGIDIILHLTEGRGGAFESTGGTTLSYVPSGQEPASIVAFSGSGLFTFARPHNAKEQDLARFEHRGVFLTKDNIDALRTAVGVSVRVGDRDQRQLDFARHVFPLVVLEMAHLYYRTLLGPSVAAFLREAVAPPVAEHLAGEHPGTDRDIAIARLIAPLDAALDEVADVIDGVLFAKIPVAEARSGATGWSFDEAFDRFVDVTFGAAGGQRIRDAVDSPVDLADLRDLESPSGLPTTVEGNRFSWETTIHPVPRGAWSTGDDYQRAVIEFMRLDHLAAAQDNLTNPAKAAADGVWRDLREVLGHAVDFGGLLAGSHREFLEVYMRHHNRLANGAALEVMEKMLALVEAGLVDLRTGPDARVEQGADRFVVRGPHTGVETAIDVLIDARVHPFDVAADERPLYPNMLRSGLVRKWRNPGQAEPDFEPGGLDLSPGFHPVTSSGGVDTRMTFLGPPSEGVMFFQLGALRPNQNHHVLQDILCWLHEFQGDLAGTYVRGNE